MYHCPTCDGKTETLETRGEARRRKCLECKHSFYTIEVYDRPARNDGKRGRPKHKAPTYAATLGVRLTAADTELNAGRLTGDT